MGQDQVGRSVQGQEEHSCFPLCTDQGRNSRKPSKGKQRSQFHGKGPVLATTSCPGLPFPGAEQDRSQAGSTWWACSKIRSPWAHPGWH